MEMNRRAERQFEAILNDPESFVGVLDTDGTLLQANETALSFVDSDPSEVEGRPFPETPWWQSDPVGRRRLREAIDTAADGAFDRFEATHTDSDGTEIAVDVSVRPVTDEDGTVVRLIAVGRDVTQRRRREAAMTSLHGATRKLMSEESAVGIAEIAVTAAEDALDLPYSSVFLYDEDDHVLRPVATTDAAQNSLDPPPTIPPGEGLLGRAYERGSEITTDDAQADDRNFGNEALRSYVIVPLGDHGALTIASSTVGMFDEYDHDLVRTLAANVEVALDRARRENRLARQNDRLEGLANALSHDLRNSLNVAQGHLQLADYEDDYTAVAANALDRMETFIDDALTLIERGELLEETTAVELQKIAEEAWEHTETEGQLRAANPPIIVADPIRLRELLGHVFENVTEYCPPTVSVEFGSLSDGFYVADDGPGWTGDSDRVFDAGYSTRSHHTGLGLTIVQRIAEAHGWMVAASDAENGGARIEFTGVETVFEP